MGGESMETKDLTVLGNRVEGSLEADQMETFPAAGNLSRVIFETKELTAFCPVTNQPDLYTATIAYHPNAKVVESKSLKLYLMRYRDVGIFGEDLAQRIMEDLVQLMEPEWLEVTLVQQVRGGLQMTTVATYGD